MTQNKRKRLPEKTRTEVLEEADYICIYCGSPADTVDHIFPYSFEDTHRRENLVAACKTCNSIAGDKNFVSFQAKLLYIQGVRNKRGLAQKFGPLPEKKNEKKPEVKQKQSKEKRQKQPPPPEGDPNSYAAKLARNLIEEIKDNGESDRSACIKIEKETGVSHKYIYFIATGRNSPGQKTISKFEALRDKLANRPAYKKRLVISYDYEELRLWGIHGGLSNEERKEALTLFWKEKHKVAIVFEGEIIPLYPPENKPEE